jgi:hypothetical protein
VTVLPARALHAWFGVVAACLVLVGPGSPQPARSASPTPAAKPPEHDGLGVAGQSATHEVVNAFWSELDRNYAVFDLRLRGRTWADVGREACAGVAGSTSAEELFAVLLRMAQALDDGHIQITAPDLGRREAGWVTGYASWEALRSLERNVETAYATGVLERAGNGHIAWGRIGAFAYLNLGAFEELSGSVAEEADTRVAHAVMSRVMRDTADAAGLIVDVRNNEGGWDAVGLEVAHWFAGPRALAYVKYRRNGSAHGAFGAGEEVHVEASPLEGRRGPVAVLTSGWTFSAAETFVLSMRVRRGVTVLGERTSGHFSDLERAELPNGWHYTYSSERYVAADGEIYEARGVPPDVAVGLDAGAFSRGRDVMLEAALELLSHGANPESADPTAMGLSPQRDDAGAIGSDAVDARASRALRPRDDRRLLRGALPHGDAGAPGALGLGAHRPGTGCRTIAGGPGLFATRRDPGSSLGQSPAVGCRHCGRTRTAGYTSLSRPVDGFPGEEER